MIAVSLPAELLNKLDCAVAKTGKKRSYLIKESLHMYLNTIEKKQIDKEIILNTSKPFYQILVDEFQNEKKLTTEARKSEFTIFSDDGKLYVINSKGNTRKLDEVYVNEFFEEYKRTGSTSTSSYQDITFNSSYLLSALKYLMENELI